jgi:hypothetical protein
MQPVGTPVRSWLRLEALAVSAAGLLVWCGLDGGWGRFALLVLLPDLSMLGYLRSPRVGAALYNVAHTFAFPMLIGIAGGLLDRRALLLTAAIWLTHIGIDRLLGLGLKYSTGFKDTHLGKLGSRAIPPTLQRTGDHLVQLLTQHDSHVRGAVRYADDVALQHHVP